jgi:hypothetical protein
MTLNDLASDRRTLHLAVSLALGADLPRARVVIVVDQLEEVFTLCNDERERMQFFANLLHATFANGGQTIVVLTMRADFYARCAAYPELAQRLHGRSRSSGRWTPTSCAKRSNNRRAPSGCFSSPVLCRRSSTISAPTAARCRC